MTEPATQTPSRMLNEHQRYELQLGDYWRILTKRRFIVILTFFSILISTIIYTNAQTPLYQASSAVRITQRTQTINSSQAFFMMPTQHNMAIFAQQITSQQVMERVVIRLGLLSPTSTATDLANKVHELQETVKADQVGGTDTIRITVVYSVPELTASIANEVAQAFAEVDLYEKSKQARNLRQFIEKQLGIFSEKLRTTEEKIRAFRETGRALGIAVGLERQLADLEKEKNQLLKQFTEQHPDVVKLDEAMKNVQDRIRELPADEIELARLQRELEINDRAYRMMKEKYESARIVEADQVSDVTVVNTAIVPKVPISPKKDLNKLLGGVIGLLLGVFLAFGLESIDTSIGTIEDVERTIRLPVIGIIPYYNPSRKGASFFFDPGKILEFIGSRREHPPDPSFLIMNQDTFSSLAEAYKILRTFIEFLVKKKPEGSVLLFTSTGPQEGKSVTAANLAIAFAQAGRKTLLMDADLRRPMIHWLFGLKRSPGLTDLLLGTANFWESRRTMGDILIGETSHWDQMMATKMLDRLEILTTGSKTPTPAEILGSNEQKKLLEQLRLQYEYIIVDSPPVLPVTDARTIGAMADATFFVYRSGKTARRALIRAKDELEMAGINVKGIILNQATPEITLTDAYYSQYYGDKGKDRDSDTDEIEE